MTKPSQPPPDPVIDEIREIRHRISARFDHDPQRLLEHYMQLQEEYRDRLLPTHGSRSGASGGGGST